MKTETRECLRTLKSGLNLLYFVPKARLPDVAKGWAKTYGFAQKPMLKAMARYARLHHRNWGEH
tara:strand:+ start:115 stop:306 length:192 start_codon:yes stop_codon:yes gene_type:complete